MPKTMGMSARESAAQHRPFPLREEEYDGMGRGEEGGGDQQLCIPPSQYLGVILVKLPE